MKLQYDPGWIRETVEAGLTLRRQSSDTALPDELQHLSEMIYEMPEERRAASIESLYAYFFIRMGFRDLFEAGVCEFPEMGLDAALVTGAAETEGTFVNRDGSALLIRVRPERPNEPERFRLWLRHELARAADMRDPAFGYPVDGPAWPAGPYENLIRDRYGLLWGIHTDARLERRGLAPLAPAEEWTRAFERSFGKIPAPWLSETFRAVRDRARLTHAEILLFAQRPEEMVKALTGARVGQIRFPGAPCPLCRFPTYVWGPSNGAVRREVAEAVREDLSGWSPEDGLCERCYEFYELEVAR